MRVTLKITTPESKTVTASNCQDAFIAAVTLAGPGKLSVYGWDWGGQPVVCKSVSARYLATTKRVGGWYVCTHADPRQMQAYLQKASQALRLGWVVELTD